METQGIDGHAVYFNRRYATGEVLCCQFPWTEVHGYPRPSLRDFDPRTTAPNSTSSCRPAQRKLLCVLRVLGENMAVQIGVCVPFAPLAPLALNGSKDLVAALLPYASVVKPEI